MRAQRLLTRSAAETAKSRTIPYSPVRVFLLSDCRLLRDAFARMLKNDPRILLIGAQGFSDTTAAEIIESGCDVLLMDPVNIRAFDTQILDAVQATLSNLQVLIIELQATISDVLSAIIMVAQREDGFVHESNHNWPVTENTPR
jgi:DNA-binding NarL/FixJ family response regulator